MPSNIEHELIPTVLTPCSHPGKIDPESMRTLRRFLYKEGATGLFVISSTGEMPLLGELDRMALCNWAVALQEACVTRGPFGAPRKVCSEHGQGMLCPGSWPASPFQE